LRWLDRIRIKRQKKTKFREMLKSGMLVDIGRAKYLGGQPELVAEKAGVIKVTSLGLFFNVYRTFDCIFVPTDKILTAESQTGGQIAQNAAFASRLALGGFVFAYKKKLRDKMIFLTVSYYEDGCENTLLFKSKAANKIATALTKAIQDFRQNSSNANLSPIELLKQVSELRARGVLSEEEYAEKKKDLLSRI
jgi:hypothetical protein